MPLPRTPLLLGLALGLALTGCGAAPPPPPPPPEEKPAPPPLAVQGEQGGMNQEAVEKRFGELTRPILDCVAEGAGRVKEIGGHFALSLRVGVDGRVLSGYLSESTLGDRATELCVLDVARGAEWPKPVGGPGQAQKSFDVDPGVEPVVWKPEKVKTVLRTLAEKTAPCKRGVRGALVTTAYVKPNGQVAAVGVAAPSADADEAIQCVIDHVKKARFGSPGRRAAKLTFEL